MLSWAQAQRLLHSPARQRFVGPEQEIGIDHSARALDVQRQRMQMQMQRQRGAEAVVCPSPV
jgi:hypothetical protein